MKLPIRVIRHQATPEPLRWPMRVGLGLFLAVLLGDAAAHGLEYRIDRTEAVVVRFSSDHSAAIANAGYRVFAPDGQSTFVQGCTDARGRAVFVPDAPGTWRLLLATEDGHGAEVEIVVAADQLGFGESAEPVTIGGMGRLTATAAGVGYVLGLGGLLALWRRRSGG